MNDCTDDGLANDTAMQEHESLPCRGCTRSCSRYGHCDGKPWRLFEPGSTTEQ